MNQRQQRIISVLKHTGGALTQKKVYQDGHWKRKYWAVEFPEEPFEVRVSATVRDVHQLKMAGVLEGKARYGITLVS